MTYNVLNQYNQYNETIASRGSHGSMNFVAVRCVRRCGLRIAFVAHAQEFRCSAVRTPLWATHCLRCIRMPKTFVALQCVRRCGPRIVFVASDRPSILFPLRRVRRCGLRVVFVASDNPSISFPLQCVRRCGLRVAVLHPTAQDLRCSAMHDFFFYRLTCSYRFMFFL